MKRVGILGGGQLGALLLESINRLGGTVAVYDPDPTAPACQRTPFSFNHDWLNKEKLSQFMQSCDIITYEFENVESTALRELSGLRPIFPAIEVLETTQDRAREKRFLSEAKLPHVDFQIIQNIAELRPAAQRFGYPFILKTARGGYDGKGQFRIEGPDDLSRFDKHEGSVPFAMVMERVLPISLEVSCIVARSPSGQEVCFPLFENTHSDHILDLSLAPARVSAAIEAEIKAIALFAARSLNVYGLLTTEFFLTDRADGNESGRTVGEWHIYINEFAPRPHNSGHVTMKACTVSQFDLLARILLAVPLQEPRIIAPGYFCMANLLGDVWLAQESKELSLSSWPRFPEVIDFVDYGKLEPRPKRKMGHLIAYAPSAQAAINSARGLRAALAQPQQRA